MKLPSYQKQLLDNGMTILTMPRRGLPLIAFQLLLKSGGVADPVGREGLASMTAEALRKGTQAYSAEEFSESLDSLGGSLLIHMDAEETTFSAEFMSKDLEAGLELLCQALRYPTFPDEEIDKLAKRRSDSIRQAKDNAGSVIQTYFDGFLFQGHPYGRPVLGTEVSTATTYRQEMADFWTAQYAPNRLIVAAVGDFEEPTLLHQIERYFGDWKTKAEGTEEVIDCPPIAGPRVLLVDKPDINQTYFRIGSLGIKRRNPDYVEIQVLNTIFGGRFTSWLNTALRINAGLTYSARSFFAAYRKRGPFVIASYTATESTDQAISMSLQQLQRFRQEGVQEEELGSVKKYIRGQFPPTMETSDQLAALIADLEFHEQDASFVDTYLDKVQALSAEAAHRLIERYFPADGLIFTCIGEAERIEAQVAKFGPITRRSITTPGF